MRVTANTYSSALLDQLNRLGNRQNALQSQAASGQRIQTPDDDPAAMQRVLDLQSERGTVAQFRKNAALVQERATASFDVLKGMKKISDRVSEIATLADGTRSTQELSAYGNEVAQLLKQAVQLGNSQFRGEYLYSGTKSDQAPFEAASDANGNITSVAYTGNTDVTEVEVAEGTVLSAQVPGANTSGTGPRGLLADSRSGSDFFAHLASLQNHLLSGDVNAIASTDRAALRADEDNLIYHVGTNGAIQTRLEATDSVQSNRADSIDKLVSHEADSDIAETLVKLNQTQTAYQAALQSGASVMRQSLLDYLR